MVPSLISQKMQAPSAEALENLDSLEPGAVQCYYKGFLAADVGAGRLNARYAQKQALDAYYAGAVDLFQIRIRATVYEYIAIGRSHPRTPIPRPKELKTL